MWTVGPRPKDQQECLSKRPVRGPVASPVSGPITALLCTAVYIVGAECSPHHPEGRGSGMPMPGYYLGDRACCDVWASPGFLCVSNHPASAFLSTWDTGVCSTPNSAKCLKPRHSSKCTTLILHPQGLGGHYAVAHTFFLAMGRPRGLS